MAVPLLAVDRFDAVMSKMQQSGIAALHDIAVIDATVTKEAMAQFGLATRSMGRSMQDDPEFFLAAGAAGVMVADLLEESHAGS